MASISHLAAGALCGAIYARRTFASPLRSLAATTAFAALALAPDLDFFVLAMGLDHTPLGHRKLTHSLPFALVVGVLVGGLTGAKDKKALACLLSVLALASHGLLDAATANGPGPQLLAPFSEAPIQFAWHPIPGTQFFQEYFTAAAVPVFAGEALWCLPFLAAAAWVFAGRDRGAKTRDV